MRKTTRDLYFSELVCVLVALMFVALAAVFVSAGESQAKDVEIKVQWDADVIELDAATGLPINTPWQNLLFFTRVDAGGYDYDAPLFTLPQDYTDGVSEPTVTPLTVDVPDGVASTVAVVVRSQATVDGKDLQSVDSDEASVVINLTPLAAFDFAAAFNEVTESVDLTWPSGDDRVKEWAVYSGDASGGPWVELTRVPVGQAETSISVPAADMFPPGQRTTKYFTMVSFGAYGVFSPNAAEVSVTRDLTEPAGVVNLKIFLTE